MTSTPSAVTLLMALHCHQPVGNFDHVFEDAYAKAYDPFLRLLARHPDLHLALHYSGPLLEWRLRFRPDFLKRLDTLVKRGQIELLAAGYYEPILPLIPEEDRQGQIARMQAALRRHVHRQATGLWLTERVWEPELPATLARAGLRYTMVDTNQFAIAKPWLPPALQVQDEDGWDLCGSYTTEYAGSMIRLFPSSKRLRYWWPFQPVERSLDFLKRLQRDQPMALTFADDGEKFGFWPQTYRWVYEEGWLERFFTRLEQERTWLTTMTFREYEAGTPTDGSVYLPCGSYDEMSEWSGGQFRNFFLKYPEANAMQQKMLRTSRTVQKVSSSKFQVSSPAKGHGRRPPRYSTLIAQARQELYAGQCNCAYWHGVFGGLYLSHLRRAVYGHLIAAESLTQQLRGAVPSISMVDADADGQVEASLATEAMSVLIDPADGGTITEWNLFGPRVNLLDTLSRRPEPYHEALKAKPLGASALKAGGPSSIHDWLGAKEEHLEAHLVYDDHRRSAFLDCALQSLPTLDEVVRSTWSERRLWSGGAFRWQRTPRVKDPLSVSMVREQGQGRIRKLVRVGTRRPTLECQYALDGLPVPVVGLEFNLSLRDPRYLKTPGELRHATRFHVEESGLGVSLQVAIDPPATLFHFPIETISESEQGLERTYQGLCILCLWPLNGASSWSGTLQWMVA